MISHFSTQFVHCAVYIFCSPYVEGIMVVWNCICLFENLKLFPMKNVMIFLLIFFLTSVLI